MKMIPLFLDIWSLPFHPSHSRPISFSPESNSIEEIISSLTFPPQRNIPFPPTSSSFLRRRESEQMYQQSWQFQASLWWHFRAVPKRGYSLREQERKHPRSQWFCFALGRFSFLGSRLPLHIWNVKCVRTYTLGFSYRAAEMKTSELEKLCMGGRELAFEEKDCIVSPRENRRKL